MNEELFDAPIDLAADDVLLVDTSNNSLKLMAVRTKNLKLKWRLPEYELEGNGFDLMECAKYV